MNESKGSPLSVAVAQFVVVAALSRTMRHVLADAVCSLQWLARHCRWRVVWRHLLLTMTSHCCHGNATASWRSCTPGRRAARGTWTLTIYSQLVGDRYSSLILSRLQYWRLVKMTDEWAVISRQRYCLCSNTDSYTATVRNFIFFVTKNCTILETRMWANAQRDGCTAQYRWRPLFNAASLADAHC